MINIISLCKAELYLVVLCGNKVSSSNEMIAIELSSADDAQMIRNNTRKQFSDTNTPRTIGKVYYFPKHSISLSQSNVGTIMWIVGLPYQHI